MDSDSSVVAATGGSASPPRSLGAGAAKPRAARARRSSEATRRAAFSVDALSRLKYLTAEQAAWYFGWPTRNAFLEFHRRWRGDAPMQYRGRFLRVPLKEFGAWLDGLKLAARR